MMGSRISESAGVRMDIYELHQLYDLEYERRVKFCSMFVVPHLQKWLPQNHKQDLTDTTS